MKAFLLYRDRDFDWARESPPNERTLTQDLELGTLYGVMARDDKFVLETVRKVVLAGPSDDISTIKYRQAALADCLANASMVRELYAITIEALEAERKSFRSMWKEYPSSLLDRSVAVVEIFVELLRRARKLIEASASRFTSEAFSTLSITLRRELDDNYLRLVRDHLKRLRLRRGVLVSARLGQGLKGAHFVLRKPNYEAPNWLAELWQWLKELLGRGPPAHHLYLSPRDEQGARAMSELRDRGVGLAADAIAQCAEHILSFFNMLRSELAFYIGCINLHGRLQELGAPVSFPEPAPPGQMTLQAENLYDVCLTLSMGKAAIGNDVKGDGKKLIIITGANQGGKSTFLRSLGVAQLMMQCGLFVPAARFSANVADGVFTHYKREEDATIRSGKFDEELTRMDELIDQLTPLALILFNESFAATNEREGSEVARQVVSALLERPFKIAFVTHQFVFAHGFFEKRLPEALFLRADRREDGQRTFKLVVGEPLRTSFGEDLYRQIFHEDAAALASSLAALRETA